MDLWEVVRVWSTVDRGQHDQLDALFGEADKFCDGKAELIKAQNWASRGQLDAALAQKVGTQLLKNQAVFLGVHSSRAFWCPQNPT